MFSERWSLGNRTLEAGGIITSDQAVIDDFLSKFDYDPEDRHLRSIKLLSELEINDETLTETETRIVATVYGVKTRHGERDKNLLSDPDIEILHGGFGDLHREDYNGELRTYTLQTSDYEQNLLISSYAPSDVDHKQWTIEQLKKLQNNELYYNERSDYHFVEEG